MLVEVPVSSIKMSFFASSCGCSRFHFVRAARTSLRSCSAACRLFFECDVMAVEKPPYRASADKNAARSQPPTNFLQCQVRFGGNQLQQPLRVNIQRRALATHGLGYHRSGLSPARHPSDRRAWTYLKRCRGFVAGRPRLNRTYNPFTQVTRASWFSRIVISTRLAHPQAFENPLRTPSESIRPDYALNVTSNTQGYLQLRVTCLRPQAFCSPFNSLMQMDARAPTKA